MTNNPDSPSPEKLRIIREALPLIRKENDQKKVEVAAKKAGIKPGDKVCPICLQKLNVVTAGATHCGVCQQHLDRGEVVFISPDGRFVFCSFDALLQQSTLGGTEATIQTPTGEVKVPAKALEMMKGKVFPITDAMMDEKLKNDSAKN